jgi:branched-chain amino acid transport system substrate-binding protein
MKKIIWAVIVVIIIIVIASLVWKKPEGVVVTEPIKIGGAYILSGPQSLIGELQKNASQMAIDEINAAGGINGRQLELVLEDSTYEPKTALSAYESLKLKGAKYIIADGSPVVSAIRPAAVADGNLVFSSGATTPGYFDNSNLSCRIALTAKNFGPGFTELLQKKGYKNVVALLPDNEYGRGLADEFTKAFTPTGGKIVSIEFYNASPTAGDYRTNITKLKSVQSQADAMVVVQVANTVEAMLQQIKDLGWTKPMVSDYYMIQNPALKNLSLANGIDFVDYQYSRDDLPTESTVSKTFKANYASKFGSTPVYLGAGHYEIVKILAEGLRNAGDDTQKVADYISKIKNYEGVTGKLSFNDDCEVSRDLVFRTVKDGKIVDVE